MTLKENCMYAFKPNIEFLYKKDNYRHCFEGLFHTQKDAKGNLILRDTYHSYFYEGVWKHNSDGKAWNLEKALKLGSIEFVCDMSEVELIQEFDTKYYKEEDVFKLTTQHACVKSCIFYFKNKNAEKDSDIMTKFLLEKIRDGENSIASIQRTIENAKENIEKIKNGEIESIYI